MLDKKPHKWFVIFIISFLLLPVLHFFDSYSILQKIRNLTHNVSTLSLSYQVSFEISELVSDTRAYMLQTGNLTFEDLNQQSHDILKKEHRLRNQVVAENKKEEINKLIELTNEYKTFIERKVVPEVRSNENDDFAPIYQQHNSLSEKLINSATSITEYEKNYTNEIASLIMTLEKEKRFFSIIIMLSLLIIIGTGTHKYFLPLFRQFYRLEHLYTHLKSAIFITDPKGNIKKINNTAEEMFELPTFKVQNRSLNELVNSFPYMQNIVQPLFDIMGEQKEITNRQVIYNYGEQRIFLTVDYFPLFLQNKIIGAAIIARPVEIHKDKRYLFEAIESERRKISIEIHDWIGRNMSPIIHSLDYILNSNADTLPEQAKNDLMKLRDHCQNAASDMRTIMNDIHPYLIDKVGLIPALEAHIRNFEQTQKIAVYLYYQDRSLSLKKTTEIVIYRIIQEALSNVSKHSNATEVDIYFLLENDKTLKIEIYDNGAPPQNLNGGRGLWSMKERANLIGGDVVYEATENGFNVTITVPFTREE